MAKMKEHDAGAVWFLQGWQANPRRELLAGLHADEVLGGGSARGRKGRGAGTISAIPPWLYCNVVNFGRAARDARQCPPRAFCALCPGCGRKQHDGRRRFYAPKEWRTGRSFSTFSPPFRCGKNRRLWRIICADLSAVATAYRAPRRKRPGKFSRRKYILRTVRSIRWNRRFAPALLLTSTGSPPGAGGCEEGTAGTHGARAGDPPALCRLRVVEGLSTPIVSTSSISPASATRRWAGTPSMPSCALSGRGIRRGFLRGTRRFFRLFSLQEEIVASDGHFLLSKWLERAKAQGRDEPEKRWFEFYARVQITTWERQPHGLVSTNMPPREWQGMLSDFYRPRWEAFVSMLELSLYAGKPLPAYRDYDREIMFAYGRKDYPLRPQGDPGKTVGRFLAPSASGRNLG